MFDNFTPEDTRKAVEIVGGRCETESSGGITYDTMLPYAQAGVDFISFGALTHSVKGAGYEFQGLLILVSFYDLLDEVKNLNVSSLFRSK